jgi:hypothetical protein
MTPGGTVRARKAGEMSNPLEPDPVSLSMRNAWDVGLIGHLRRRIAS